MRKILPTFLVIALSLFLSGCGKKTPPVVNRPKIEEPVNTVPIENRVYSTLTVKKDGDKPLGRELNLTIYDSKKASSIEYEIEYQTGTSVQGGSGLISPAKETLPYQKTIFLGTCSAGGACSYHEDVKGGTLILRFKNSSVGNLKGEWSYFLPGNDGQYSSRDGKFQLTALDLKNGYTLISQTMGLPASPIGGPEKIIGEVIAGPYNLDSTTNSKKIWDLSIRLSEDVTSAKLLFWDGKTYQNTKNTIKDKTLSAKITSLGTYLVAK